MMGPILGQTSRPSARRRAAWRAASLLATACWGWAATAAEPQAPAAKVSYYKEVAPIFQARCQGCHQPAKRGGDYVMTNFESLLKGGESGEVAITPGKPEASRLVAQITPDKGQADMPKDAPPLTDAERDLITRWIREGAGDDSPPATRQQYDMSHPPEYVGLPVVTSLDYSPDGKHLAVSGYHEILLHNADGSGLAARLVGLSERIQAVAFSPDGKRLAAAGGSPGRMGEFQVWDVEKRALLLAQTLGFDTLYGVSWSGDGKRLSVGCPDNSVRVFDADTGKQVMFNGAHEDWVLDTVFSAAGDHVITVSRDRSMKLIHIETQRFIDNLTSITPGALRGGLHAVARHPQKDELLAAGADGEPKLYKMTRDKARQIGDDFNLVRKYAALPGRLNDAAFSRDGALLVVGSSFRGGGEVRVFQYADAKQLAAIQSPSGVFAAAFHPEGKTIAAAGFDGVVRLYEAATGALVKEFPAVEIPR